MRFLRALPHILFVSAVERYAGSEPRLMIFSITSANVSISPGVVYVFSVMRGRDIRPASPRLLSKCALMKPNPQDRSGSWLFRVFTPGRSRRRFDQRLTI